jgi:hypothetical protein
MENKIVLALALTLSGCCVLKYPLDGKAQSWCEAESRAEKNCKKHGGIFYSTKGYNKGYGQKLYSPIEVTCADGTILDNGDKLK